MNDNDITQKVPQQNDADIPNDDGANSVRVFDISADSILPINDDPPVLVHKNPPVQNNQTPNQNYGSTQQAKLYIPPDAEMLDKKIGTFDATPFASAKNPVLNISGQPIKQSVSQPSIQTPNKFVSSFNTNLQQSLQKSSHTSPIIPSTKLPLPNLTRPTPVQNSAPQIPPNLPTGQTLQQPVTLVAKKPTPIHLQNISVPVPNPDQKKPNLPIDSLETADKTSNQSDIVKPIRTYEGDVADAMSHRRTSTASIAIAESKKMEGEEKISNKNSTDKSSRSFLKLAMITISILLLGGGAVGAYYLYSISPLAPVTPTTPREKTTPSIIPSNTQAVIKVDNQNSITIQSRIQNEILKAQAPNTIKEIVVAKTNSAGLLTRMSGPNMIQELDINVPDILIRSLATSWMLGVHNDSENNKGVFVVATSNYFQNTFAGMLQWESIMADDIKRYLFPSEPEGISNVSSQKDAGVYPYANPLDNLSSILPSTASSSTTTITKSATTTTISTSTKKTTQKIATSSKSNPLISTSTEVFQPLRSFIALRGKFEDKIVKNKDVREFRTDDGKILFLYSFIDSNHLVITTSEATLAEIITRLEKQSFIR